MRRKALFAEVTDSSGSKLSPDARSTELVTGGGGGGGGSTNGTPRRRYSSGVASVSSTKRAIATGPLPNFWRTDPLSVLVCSVSAAPAVKPTKFLLKQSAVAGLSA